MKLRLQLLQESFRFAWQALVVNKLRTILSLLGVTIGIFSIILVLSMVDSLEADMKSSFDMIGSDILFIQIMPMTPEEGDEEYEWWKYAARPHPTLEEMERLKDRMTLAQHIAFRSYTETTAAYGNSYLNDAFAIALTYEFKDVLAFKLSSGRYFTRMECAGSSSKVIIGDVIRENLFGDTEPIGKDIKVGGLRATVIGVIEKEGTSLFGNGLDKAILMPIRFGGRLIRLGEDNGLILIKGKEGVGNDELKDEVIANFRPVRKVKPGAENNFSVVQSSAITGIIENITGFFNWVGILIGIFSILVGAFSIANIMFVSVRERTNIIGIQKSLGARNSFILRQFLFESVLLSLIGGVFGLLMVYLVFLLLGSFVDFNFILPLKRIVLGLFIAGTVGLLSGIIPAMVAARMNPVDAIRSK
jgi:putative ABC transport system permease protein